MRVLLIGRNAAFYALFYLGSVPIVIASALLLTLGARRAGAAAVAAWPRWQRLCLRLCLGITVALEGVVPAGQVLVALKHEAFFEAIDLPRLFAYPSVFAKAELMRIPFWGMAARAYGLVEVEREQGASALRRMLAAARRLGAEGRLLAIFPEGTRTPHGQRAPLQSGFAGIYKLLGWPVVPIAVNSGPLYHRWLKRPGVITYRIGEAIPPGLPRAEIETRVLDAINALNPGANGSGAGPGA